MSLSLSHTRTHTHTHTHTVRPARSYVLRRGVGVYERIVRRFTAQSTDYQRLLSTFAEGLYTEVGSSSVSPETGLCRGGAAWHTRSLYSVFVAFRPASSDPFPWFGAPPPPLQ
jgi:hypothetical protein